MRILIIGGTGNFSGRVTESAVAHGHDVTLYNRGQSPSSFELPLIKGLRSEIGLHSAEIASFDPEAVIDAICYKSGDAEDLVALFEGIERLIMISTVDTYGQDTAWEPVTEDLEPFPVSDYGIGKLASEKLLQQVFGRRATIFRPSHILGPGFLTTSLWSRSPNFVDRVRKGKMVPAIDGGRNLMTPVHAGDVAEWVVRALEKPTAGGQVFNAVGGQIITQKRYYELVAQTLGVDLRLVAVPSHVFSSVFSSPPQFNWHRPYSCQKAVDLLEYEPQWTAETMIQETVEHMLTHGLVGDCSEEAFDDRLTELLLRHESELLTLLEDKKSEQQIER